MKLIETNVSGAFVAELEKFEDERGFFARAFCAREFEAAGLDPTIAQTNLSFNPTAGTMRGIHWQDETAPEAKFVRCIRGAIWDLTIDLRPGSPTHGQYLGVELSADNRKAVFVPALCGHGYLTLVDETEVLYNVSGSFTPSAERGMRYDDPAFDIEWPREVALVSEKDRAWPDYSPG